MTPKQKQIVAQRSMIDVEKYTAILDWFVRRFGHPRYEGIVPSDECQQPKFIKEPDDENNTDDLKNPEVDFFINKSFDFSAGQEPSCTTSVNGNEQQFLMNLIHQKQPTLLACGGNYFILKDIGIENCVVTIFPFGVRGPKIFCWTKVSQKECLRKYMRTSFPHFMCGDTVQIMNHMFLRILSFETGVMVGWSNYGGKPLAEPLAKLTQEDIESASKDNSKPLTAQMAFFTRLNLTTCWALG